MKGKLAAILSILYGLCAFMTTYGLGTLMESLFSAQTVDGGVLSSAGDVISTLLSLIPEELRIYVIVYLAVTVIVLFSKVNSMLSARTSTLVSAIIAALAGALVMAGLGIAIVMSVEFEGALGAEVNPNHLGRLVHIALSAATGAAIGATAGAIIDFRTKKSKTGHGGSIAGEADY